MHQRTDGALRHEPDILHPDDFGWELGAGPTPGRFYVFNNSVLDHRTMIFGGGNASARPYNTVGLGADARAVGICTGDVQGPLQSLTLPSKNQIDSDVGELTALLRSGRLSEVRHSTSVDAVKSPRPLLATGVFGAQWANAQCGTAVRKYITTQIYLACGAVVATQNVAGSGGG